MITPTTETHVRAARELLRWDQKKLAGEAGLGLATIRRYETGHPISEEGVAKITNALIKAGILFFGATTIDETRIKAAIALTPKARPDSRPAKRVYKRPKKDQTKSDAK